MPPNRKLQADASTGWVGLDVGGANLKAADGAGRADSVPFELWRKAEQLADAVRAVLARFPHDRVALTMTGELADCYATKAEGVRAIVGAVRAAAGGCEVRVATVDDRWLTLDEACRTPLDAAAANWRPGARLAASAVDVGSRGVWVDVGSTTIDVIPLAGGRVATDSRTDTQRLLAGELLYTGVRRTPVCAVASTLPYRGASCPVAAEVFATTADVWLLLGELPSAPDAAGADGRPLTPAHAVTRLGRCVAADAAEFDADDARVAAEHVANRQAEMLAAALRSQAELNTTVGVTGEGGFLVEQAAERLDHPPLLRRFDLGVGPAAAACWPAHAAAVLAARELP